MNEILSGKTGVLLLDRMRLADVTGTNVELSSRDAHQLLELVNEVALWVRRGQPYARGSELAESFARLVGGGA